MPDGTPERSNNQPLLVAVIVPLAVALIAAIGAEVYKFLFVRPEPISLFVLRKDDGDPIPKVEVKYRTNKDGAHTGFTDQDGYLQIPTSSQEVYISLRKSEYETKQLIHFSKEKRIVEVKLASSPKPATKYNTPVRLNNASFSELNRLLKAGRWKEADRQTAKVMLEAAGREKEGWIEKKRMEQFSCEDVRRIDNLWLTYSKNQFGFSIQKQVFQGDLNNFGERIGWRRDEKWLTYKDLGFNLQAPPGNLPSVWQPGNNKPLSGGWIAYNLLSPNFSNASKCL